MDSRTVKQSYFNGWPPMSTTTIPDASSPKVSPISPSLGCLNSRFEVRIRALRFPCGTTDSIFSFNFPHATVKASKFVPKNCRILLLFP